MKILFIVLFAINLYADVKQDILNLYQNNKYEESCNLGFDNFGRYNKDEEYLSLFASKSNVTLFNI